MRIILALLVLPIFFGCASNAFTVTLIRTGTVSGITERYAVNQDAVGTKSIALGTDSDAKRSTYAIDPQLMLRVRALAVDSFPLLSAITLHDTGEVTTGIEIDAHHSHVEIMWAKVDPPRNEPSVLDSFYQLMLRVEGRMTASE